MNAPKTNPSKAKEIMLNPDDFKNAIQAIDGLGATPAVLVKTSELVNDPNADIGSICALLRCDGALAADIIRIANSPYYAPAFYHSNLNGAVSQIGLREVNRVVSLSLARQLFARDLHSYGVSAFAYWSESVASALVMEALAKLCGLNVEDAYTIGILQAIGRVLINHVIEEQGFTIYWDGKEPINEWERRSVGFDFAEAGAMLLEHWRFPAPTCDVLRWQLDAEKVADQASLLGLLEFTHRLLAMTGSDFDNKEWSLSGGDPFAQTVGLTHEAASQIITNCRRDFQSILQSVDLT